MLAQPCRPGLARSSFSCEKECPQSIPSRATRGSTPPLIEDHHVRSTLHVTPSALFSFRRSFKYFSPQGSSSAIAESAYRPQPPFLESHPRTRPQIAHHDARPADHLHRAPRELCTLSSILLCDSSHHQLTLVFASLQLYLALYLRLIPLPATIQDDIIPVVRLPYPLYTPHTSVLLRNATACERNGRTRPKCEAQLAHPRDKCFPRHTNATPPANLFSRNATAPLLGPSLLRRIPPRLPRLGRPHLQRHPRGARRAHGRDRDGQGRAAEAGRHGGLRDGPGSGGRLDVLSLRVGKRKS